jgi:hypothetical protein
MRIDETSELERVSLALDLTHAEGEVRFAETCDNCGEWWAL